MKVIEADMVKDATIYITEVDRQRFEKLIEIAGERDALANHQYLNKLEHELERAETVAPGDVPAPGVCAVAFPPLFPAPQVARERTAACFVRIAVLINALVADRALLFETKASRNLCGTPLLAQ